LADDDVHRLINDTGTSDTDLFSAAKILTLLALKANTSHTHNTSDITAGTLPFSRGGLGFNSISQYQFPHADVNGRLAPGSFNSNHFLFTGTTLGAKADALKQKIDIQKDGTSIATRCAVNFVGSDVSVSEDVGNNRVDITIAGSGVIGIVSPYAGSTAPSGWLLCDGAAVSRTTYTNLFGLIGTTYGSGDGSTTFNVPDLRGRVPVGKDNMGGTAANRITSASTGGANSTTLGGAIGSQTHQLLTGEIPSHDHTVGYANTAASGSGRNSVFSSGSSSTSGSVGGDGAHSNTQPGLIMSYIIFAGV